LTITADPTERKALKPSEVVELLIVELETRGLSKGKYLSDTGQACLIGGLRLTLGHNPNPGYGSTIDITGRVRTFGEHEEDEVYQEAVHTLADLLETRFGACNCGSCNYEPLRRDEVDLESFSDNHMATEVFSFLRNAATKLRSEGR